MRCGGDLNLSSCSSSEDARRALEPLPGRASHGAASAIAAVLQDTARPTTPYPASSPRPRSLSGKRFSSRLRGESVAWAIADHRRAAAFLITARFREDGAEYVLRRIMPAPSTTRLSHPRSRPHEWRRVIGLMGETTRAPEPRRDRAVILGEGTRFRGPSTRHEVAGDAFHLGKGATAPGDVAFRSTTPTDAADLTAMIRSVRGCSIERAAPGRDGQAARPPSSTAGPRTSRPTGRWAERYPTVFTGYASTTGESEIGALVPAQGDRRGRPSRAVGWSSGSPFYAERAGQWATRAPSAAGPRARRRLPPAGGTCTSTRRVVGEAPPGRPRPPGVDERAATHPAQPQRHPPLHFALRRSSRARGAEGVAVAPERLRFDFCTRRHDRRGEAEVERLVNERVLDNAPWPPTCSPSPRPRPGASPSSRQVRRRVRMVQWRVEGAVRRTTRAHRDIGLFKILARRHRPGVRRIERSPAKARSRTSGARGELDQAGRMRAPALRVAPASRRCCATCATARRDRGADSQLAGRRRRAETVRESGGSRSCRRSEVGDARRCATWRPLRDKLGSGWSCWRRGRRQVSWWYVTKTSSAACTPARSSRAGKWSAQGGGRPTWPGALPAENSTRRSIS